ncbi:hypothetical protein A6R68_12746 [Neotoma lepida]|uniref:SRCR domain-containing protein n=1 Tax=Neotoma lepida TaxID=56216 RepID=A0A1A6H253_NEOLE|nr:hypothetical protein A6R68_12746 [Neotoma lepida]
MWLDEVECLGSGVTLEACQAELWGHRDCTHKEDADVHCVGSGMLGHLQSDGIYEDIEVVPVQKKEEKTTLSRLLMQEEGYDDAEEPEDQSRG